MIPGLINHFGKIPARSKYPLQQKTTDQDADDKLTIPPNKLPWHRVNTNSVDDMPCAPDDKDLNTPYQCDSCDKTIKGKVIDVGSYTFGNPFKRSEI